jgi:pimeloyl-ACP methyl ester carboxylesterase
MPLSPRRSGTHSEARLVTPTQEPAPLHAQLSKRDAVAAAAALHRYRRHAGQRLGWPVDADLGVEVEALREDPSPIADLSVPDTLAHLESVIRELDRPPILMGHSFGGLLMQLLLDRGLGVAGVAIDSAPPEGIRKVPLAQIKATFAVLENPANRHRAVPFILRAARKAG